jgi:hypothetical protein
VNLTVEIVGAVVVALIVITAVLRFRKLRRDEMRQLATPIERRLLTPPPSPYAPSKGFRLLDGPIDRLSRPEPVRPRLESDRDYVFSESQMPNYDDVRSVPLRHNETWAFFGTTRRRDHVGRGSPRWFHCVLPAGFVREEQRRHWVIDDEYLDDHPDPDLVARPLVDEGSHRHVPRTNTDLLG